MSAPGGQKLPPSPKATAGQGSLLQFIRPVFIVPPGDSGPQFNMPSTGHFELRPEYKSAP